MIFMKKTYSTKQIYDFNGEVLPMLRSLYKQAVEEKKPVLEWVYLDKVVQIPNLTEEFITSEEAPEELRDYYTFVVQPLLEERYYHDGETTEAQLFDRVASVIGADDYERSLFYYIMRLRLFMPSSPTLMNAGREKGTLSSCFVIIPDDDMRSIASYWKNMSLVQKYGGGVGTDWSALRPKGDPVSGTNGIASGFAPFLAVANEINNAIKQGSARSGANASTMRYDHPDIMEFLDFKRDDPSKYGFFNLSVTFDDEGFMKCWNGEEVELVHEGKVYGTINGRDILRRMAENAWLTGDPSPYFLDRTNETWKELGIHEQPDPFGFRYNLRISHNPCGEQNLPNWGVCNLGSVNLFTMVNPYSYELQYDLLRVISKVSTIFLDRVIDANWFPNWKIEKQSKRLRNIGLGFMGLADVMYLAEVNYDSEEAITIADNVSYIMTEASKEQSDKMGRILGEAPVLRDTEFYYRNTDFTCIAPTGSISLLSLCNSGVEPYFAMGYKKLVYPKGTRTIEKYIDVKPPAFMLYDRAKPKTSHEIAPKSHVDVLSVVSDNVTNAVSKTTNLPNSATVDDIMELYKYAFDSGVKSITIFRDGCRDDLALVVDEEKEEKCCANPNIINKDGCMECTNCHWAACSV